MPMLLSTDGEEVCEGSELEQEAVSVRKAEHSKLRDSTPPQAPVDFRV
jgi:hypothetical protein